MNKDKIIKDLKERNHKLQRQSRQHEARECHYLYKCEQLEKRINKVLDIIDDVLLVGIKDYRSQLEIIAEILKGDE